MYGICMRLKNKKITQFFLAPCFHKVQSFFYSLNKIRNTYLPKQYK